MAKHCAQEKKSQQVEVLQRGLHGAGFQKHSAHTEVVQGLPLAQILQHVTDTGETKAKTAVKGAADRHDRDDKSVV